MAYGPTTLALSPFFGGFEGVKEGFDLMGFFHDLFYTSTDLTCCFFVFWGGGWVLPKTIYHKVSNLEGIK